MAWFKVAQRCSLLSWASFRFFSLPYLGLGDTKNQGRSHDVPMMPGCFVPSLELPPL
jgi:hypothetical protein